MSLQTTVIGLILVLKGGLNVIPQVRFGAELYIEMTKNLQLSPYIPEKNVTFCGAFSNHWVKLFMVLIPCVHVIPNVLYSINKC